MTGFLSKPFTVEQLRQSIEQVTRHAAAERMNDHPLYEFALTLGDMEPDVFGGVTMH